MGGSGGMLHAITTMKNNMALRKSKRKGSKNRNLTGNPKKTEYNFAKVSDEELEKIKINIRLKARKSTQINILITLVLSIGFIYLMYYVLFKA